MVEQTRVCITGGAGYVGSQLVPSLVHSGIDVTVYDTLWFGNHLPRQVRVVKGDIRDTEKLKQVMAGHDVVIHLACISNDPSFELDESLSRTINYECFEPMVITAKEVGVRRFIYCSTSSVYGVSDADDVREDHPLVPLTLYNTYKAKCEPELLRHIDDKFTGVIVRPSTICGYSSRQRLDLAVNIFVNLAINKGQITVFGGAQKRPNLHIKDMVEVYRSLIAAPHSVIQGQTFNVGAGNRTIIDLARLVQRVVTDRYPNKPHPEIVVKAAADNRSYQVNSDKFRKMLRWEPIWSIEDAVNDLCRAFEDGLIPAPLTNDNYYNVRRMHTVWKDIYREAPPSAVDPTKGHLSEIDVMHRGAGAVSE